MITTREKLCLILAINVNTMEMMYALGLSTGQNPDKDRLLAKCTGLIMDICEENGLKITRKDIKEIGQEFYLWFNKTNDVTQRTLLK